MPTKVCLVKVMVFPVVMYEYESQTVKKAERQGINAFELWCWRRLLRVLGLQEDHTSQPWRKSVLNIRWKDCCWSWNSNTLATWCEKLTHLKSPWCWERLKSGEGDDRGWDGWMDHGRDGHEFKQVPGVVMDREAWHAVVHGVEKSWTWLSNWTELKHLGNVQEWLWL